MIVHFGETLFVQGGQVGAKFEREGENWQEEEGEIYVKGLLVER